MKCVYDNGAIMIGAIDLVIAKVENEIKEDLDMCLIDAEELLKDLKELKESMSTIEIISVNYDNGMGYSIDYWHTNDKINI